jgi:catechol 2,3-dioxygenase-like lactoylglutathione lyase family enzyme
MQHESAAIAGRVRIGSVVIHCHEFDRMLAFWQEALGYVPRRPPDGGWVVLVDPTARGPNISLQARDRPAKGRSWLHLDLYTPVRDQEVHRLLRIGARRYPWRYQPHHDYIVLEDPDGNLFCVVQKSDSL